MNYRIFRSFVPILVVVFVALSFTDAAARAGRSRSFGSRGTSSYGSTARPSPSYDSSRSRQNPATSQGQPFGQSQPGGFLRGMGGGLLGGIAGGLLGGMLFRSLGFAGAGTGMGGGFGLFELALLAGGAYLLYRFIAARRRTEPVSAGAPFFGQSSLQGGTASFRSGSQEAEGWGSTSGPSPADGLAQIRRTDPGFDEGQFRDKAQDIFFRVQGAWTRRDLTSVAALLGDEVHRTLQGDVDDLRRRGEINRLENIAVRDAEIVEARQEQGQDILTLRLLASLLDYTTDEAGRVSEGSDRDPVKFEEYWTFARPTGAGPWRLTAIQQA